MFIDEHFIVHTRWTELPAESSFLEASRILKEGTAVYVSQESNHYMFTQEDAWLLELNPEMSLRALCAHEGVLSSPALPYREPLGWDGLASIHGSLQRPIMLLQPDGIPAGYLLPSELMRTAAQRNVELSSYFAGLADTVTDAVTAVDRNGTVIVWNAAAEELYGIPKDQILGKVIGEHFDPAAVVVLGLLDEGRMLRHTYHRPREHTHVLINASPITDEKGHIIGGIAAEQDITQLVRLNDELSTVHVHRLKRERTEEDPFAVIQARGETMGTAIRLAKKIAKEDNPVLLIGENGVGKEHLARMIHQASPRTQGPFHVINCGAMPAGLLETELFGYQGGAFSGDGSGRPGKLELCAHGTLFLNELDLLPPELQARLYRTLQQKSVVRTGGEEAVPTSVRLIAAVEQDLEQMVQHKQFRQDLYYALNVVSIYLPPLRRRREDISALVPMYVREYAVQHQKPILQVDPAAMHALIRYEWPGNLSELRSVIERCVILSDGDQLLLEHLPIALQREHLPLAGSDEEPADAGLPSGTAPNYHVEDSSDIESPPADEVQQIRDALHRTFGNKAAAARLLGISRGTLYNKMREHEIQ
ncbi:sigma 54-interacting transcriptional regulator [Paenibacillus sp. JX-17]|uniref:Sigma 54-interacting transcriptional regulator n=1 Tax=Paenibacillus lacisoli TaxID=3064525 RepID=A0ABT9CBB7_9BACL|nr:sigma 54-interacting transcriptional regulator [Paenibacillus sp. JX-17]MDO7906555.1 sigma 54-interacting transcriptional regulator [Paenibacillus sp. JX-17]